MAETATATMAVPSYRGKPGLSSATNSSRISLISHFHEKDKQMKQTKQRKEKEERKEKENQKVNVTNKKSGNEQQGEKKGTSSSKNSGQNSSIKKTSSKDSNSSNKESNANTSNKNTTTNTSSSNKNKNDSNPNHRNHHKHRDPENLLPEIDRIRGLGVGKDNATPQELYAIGAVFDHIYRGGSPMNCISVFRKEVNRAPQQSIGCGLFGPEGADDDDTLPTMDWTHNRSYADLYTLDEDGTYIRSFLSRDDSLQSALDAERARAIRLAHKANAKSREGTDKPHPPHQPWDESTLNTTGAKIGGIYSNNNNTKKKASKAYFPSEMSGIKRGKAKSSERRNQHHDQHPTSSSPHRNKSVFDDTSQNYDAESIETMERLKIWSEVLLAAAKEAVMDDDDGTESGRSRSEGPTINCAGTNISSLVRMFRSTVEETIPEDTKASTAALAGDLVRAVSNNFGRNSDGPYHSEEDDCTFSTEDSFSTFLSAAPRPLNSLAKAMRSIAKKEPSRTYAASEQDQVVGRQQQQEQQGEATTITPAMPPKSQVLNPGPASVATSVESDDTPPPRDPRKRKPSRSPPSKRNAVSNNTQSVSGISRTDTDGVGSHRGDAVSVLPKVPSSIGVPRSTSTSTTLSVLQDLFIEPTRGATASSAAPIPHRRSFFKRRENDHGGLGDSTHGKPMIPAVSQTSSSPRRNLPPVPPARSPTTLSAASPSRNLHMSSDNDGTELSIIGFAGTDAADTTTVVTPPRSTGAAGSSSSPKSTSGISIKKLVSFRKRKPSTPTKYHDQTANPSSPRSAMGVHSQIFQSATDNTSAYNEESVVACIADETMEGNESIVVTPMRFHTHEEETSSTGGVLLTQSNGAASSEYEVQSV